ncbi:MAG TPA: PHP domain-containing protein [Ktedonobacterales bacterium]
MSDTNLGVAGGDTTSHVDRLPRRIDLHTHSTASDGLYTPAELVRMASTAGLDLIALTDHDSTAGIDEAHATGAGLGVSVVAGIEINTDLPSGGVAHVLGYHLDWRHDAFQGALEELRAARERRAIRMVEKLNQVGLDITWARVRALAQGAVGRPHIAQALIEKGHATSVSDAFDRWLSKGRPGFVPRVRVLPEDAVRLIRGARGVPSLAHPAYIQTLEDDLLPRLVAAGLLGLETYYGEYPPETVERLKGLADRHGLIPTGGSDYHGPGLHPTPLGGRFVPPEVAERLGQAAEELRQAPAPGFALELPEEE